MPVEKIVLNASPLILLCNSKLSFVLPKLFPEISMSALLLAPAALTQNRRYDEYQCAGLGRVG